MIQIVVAQKDKNNSGVARLPRGHRKNICISALIQMESWHLSMDAMTTLSIDELSFSTKHLGNFKALLINNTQKIDLFLSLFARYFINPQF